MDVVCAHEAGARVVGHEEGRVAEQGLAGDFIGLRKREVVSGHTGHVPSTIGSGAIITGYGVVPARAGVGCEAMALRIGIRGNFFGAGLQQGLSAMSFAFHPNVVLAHAVTA